MHYSYFSETSPLNKLKSGATSCLCSILGSLRHTKSCRALHCWSYLRKPSTTTNVIYSQYIVTALTSMSLGAQLKAI